MGMDSPHNIKFSNTGHFKVSEQEIGYKKTHLGIHYPLSTILFHLIANGIEITFVTRVITGDLSLPSLSANCFLLSIEFVLCKLILEPYLMLFSQSKHGFISILNKVKRQKYYFASPVVSHGLVYSEIYLLVYLSFTISRNDLVIICLPMRAPMYSFPDTLYCYDFQLISISMKYIHLVTITDQPV